MQTFPDSPPMAKEKLLDQQNQAIAAGCCQSSEMHPKSDTCQIGSTPIQMIRQTVLKRSGLKISRICMGLSHLHHMKSSRDRDRLIEEARDLGITHFDTAPLYGDGLAESALGSSLRPVRSEVTIATKFGLLPSRWIGSLGVLGLPFHACRALLRRSGLISWPKRSFSVDEFQKGLLASLKALKTDYIDIFFLHEPTLQDMESNRELLDGMIRAKQAGTIRAIGIAGTGCGPILSRFQETIDVIQTAESDWDGAAFVPDLTYGAITAGRAASGNRGSGANSVGPSLRRALSRRPEGAVVVGTTKVAHLRQLAEFAADT